MTRYQVYGYYTDEPQVVIDIVDAESPEDAERIITEARGGESSGYTSDGAELLTDTLANVQTLLAQSPEEIAKGIDELRAQYCDNDTETD